ncbi:MAG: hypothetical protein ACTSUF_03430 [Candidatus Heimdallarchaeaceae archaeon]
MKKTKSVKAKIETIKRVVERKAKTYEARKAKALAEGKRFERIVCPLCLWSRPMRTHKKGKIIFKIDPNPEIIQVRYGIGGQKHGGFFKKEDECIRLSELKDANTEVYNNLKTEVKKLYNLFYKEGK